MKLSLGFSPCPNDTFIFDALVHQKIDMEGLTFDVQLADVKELNTWAQAGKLDISKLSFHAYAHVFDQYILLDAGSALGFGCGPLLIAQSPLDESAVNEGPVAIPGELTTAHFLLNLAYPQIKNKRVHIFSDIEAKVLDGSVQAGLIIHENRFTYADKGLVKLIDLGQFWEDKFNLPIPLGGIFCKRSFSPALAQKINRVIRRSVEYAFSNPESPKAYIQAHAQEMDPAVQQKHIDLYVNDFSVDLGEQGRQAIQHLFDFGRNQGIIPLSEKPIFLKYSE